MTSKSTTATFDLINPEGLYDASANGYSHIADIPHGRRLIIVSGQGGETADGQLQSEFRAQVRQAMANLQTALADRGAKLSDVAKFTVLIVDHSQERLVVFGEELQRVMGEGRKPACTLIPVLRLALDGMLFEIEAIAVPAQ